jgi:hypothetical protein
MATKWDLGSLAVSRPLSRAWGGPGAPGGPFGILLPCLPEFETGTMVSDK